jgi:hypothetical protein
MKLYMQKIKSRPFHLFRKSIFGSCGPGTDSKPENPERIPAFTAMYITRNEFIEKTSLNNFQSFCHVDEMFDDMTQRN